MLLVQHVTVSTVNNMWSAEECREVENIAEAVDYVEFSVGFVAIDTFKIEADIFQQHPSKNHQKLVNFRLI